MKRVGIVRGKEFLSHFAAHPHPENPDRLLAIHQMLDREKIDAKSVHIPLRPASEDEILLVHSKEHFERVKESSSKEFLMLDDDTYTCRSSFDTALLAAGSTIEAVESILSSKIDSAFAFVRPPGHHAEKDRAMGFCIFNNIAIAARHAIVNRGLKRLAIFDFDLHHGNGTQNSFYDTDSVLYVSAHQFPHYPGTGTLEEVGAGQGKGFNLNFPLPAGCGDAEYITLMTEIIEPVIMQYAPEIILISAGFDIYSGDPLGGMQVTGEGFEYMGRALRKLADSLCKGRILYVLEGGYSSVGLQEGSYRMIESMLAENPESPGKGAHEISEQMRRLFDSFSDNVSKYWKV